MDDVKFSNQYEDLISKTFGIRRNQVMEVLATPDKTDEIDFHGSGIKLHTKHFSGKHPPYTLLVIESLQGHDRVVSSALRAYPQLSAKLQELRPFEILGLLTDSFGLLIQVGQQKGRMIAREIFDLERTGGNLVQGLETPRGSMIQEIYFKSDPASHIAYCALAFCIDTDLYSAWLTSAVRSRH
jgi:hypothetical protein